MSEPRSLTQKLLGAHLTEGDLVPGEEADYEQVSQGETWRIESVREVVSAQEPILAAKSDAGREIELEARLLAREREILVAGGMLKYLRGGGRQRIGIVEGESASAESGASESGGRS